MTGQELALGSFNPSRAPTPKKRRASASFIRAISGAALLAVAAWIVATRLDYTPDSDLGYNLGIAGGTALLLTLIYPLSKRLRFIHSWVPLKHWFRTHMVFGILGPMLILLHSRFALESINGTLAFCSMWLVFLSGVTGRYLHTRIHRSLTDKRALLQELNRQIGVNAEDVRSKFHFAPRVTQRLERFHSIVPAQPKGALHNLGRMLALPFRLRWTYARASKDLQRAIKKRAHKRAWPRAKKRQRLSYGKKMIRTYLEAVRSVARIDGYERLFSLWHFVHVPLLFWLVITGVIHVLAVHKTVDLDRLGLLLHEEATAVQEKLSSVYPLSWITEVTEDERRAALKAQPGKSRSELAQVPEKVAPGPRAGGHDHRGIYVVNLLSSRTPDIKPKQPLPNSLRNYRLYTTTSREGGKVWYRLRLGFFATEQEAKETGELLKKRYPDVRIDRISGGEKEAQAGLVLSEGRKALTSGDNSKAIPLFTQVLHLPTNPYTQEARELLGLARERNGQIDLAKVEYKLYLKLYPTSEDSDRVRQRLSNLTGGGGKAAVKLKAPAK